MRELPPDDPVPFGIALEILNNVDAIEELCKSVRRDALKLELALARSQERTAAGFRAHTKTTVARFPEPIHEPIPGIASHGCALDDDTVEEIDRCGE